MLVVKSTYASDLLIKTSNATKRWFMTVTLDFHWKAKLMMESPPAASQVQNTKGTTKETIIKLIIIILSYYVPCDWLIKWSVF